MSITIRNAEHYMDTTAFNGIMDAPQPGEVWMWQGKEVLIIRNQGTLCNVLALTDKCNGSDSVEVKSRSLRYTNPAMLQYAFNAYFGEFIKKIQDDEFDDILCAVREVLGFDDCTEYCENKPVKEVYCPEDTLVELNAKSAEIENLRGQVALLKEMYGEVLQKCLANRGTSA